MENTISRKSSVKASAAKTLGKPLPMDKDLCIDIEIISYELEYGDKAEEGKQPEILITQDKILAASKQNLVKMRFPYIDMFDREVPAVVSAMFNLTSGLFEQI